MTIGVRELSAHALSKGKAADEDRVESRLRERGGGDRERTRIKRGVRARQKKRGACSAGSVHSGGVQAGPVACHGVSPAPRTRTLLIHTF